MIARMSSAAITNKHPKSPLLNRMVFRRVNNRSVSSTVLHNKRYNIVYRSLLRPPSSSTSENPSLAASPPSPKTKQKAKKNATVKRKLEQNKPKPKSPDLPALNRLIRKWDVPLSCKSVVGFLTEFRDSKDAMGVTKKDLERAHYDQVRSRWTQLKLFYYAKTCTKNLNSYLD